MKRFTHWIVVFALAGFALLPVGATAQRVEFILDGSGSMWGQAGGEAKIAAAKRTMTDLLRDIELPPGASLGLTVYGHRAKGDCGDIEHFPPVGYGQRAELLPTIQGIQPKGMTPIADSLRVVGDALKGSEQSSSIVLVSDGVESCNKDPCEVARQLREEYGIDVVIHVVGFDVREGQEQLACIAEKGGGVFVKASNPAELEDALTKVKEVVVQGSSEPEPINVAAAANGGHIVLFTSAYGAYVPEHLIDGTQKGWASQTRVPQSIVIGFDSDRRARIEDLLINPHLATSDSSQMAKEISVYASEVSPWEGYTRVGALTLEPVAGQQVLTFDPPIEARYLKLRFLNNHGHYAHIVASEVLAMGRLLDGPPPPPAPENLSAASAGGSVQKAASEYGGYVAKNLIDGTTSTWSWCSGGNTPQEVTLQLAGTGARQVYLMAVNPYSQQGPEAWAREVEVSTSAESSYKGFVSRGHMELEQIGDYQVLRFPEPIPARYVRLRFLSNHGHYAHICAGEVVVLGGAESGKPSPTSGQASGVSSNPFSGVKSGN